MLAAALRGFPNSKADEDTLLLYVMALDDVPFVEFRAALTKLLKTARFFPTIAEICETAESLHHTMNDDKELDAGQAWEEAMRLVRTCHVYKEWTYSTPDVEQAVKQFGKQELCALEMDGVGTARAQFRRIYDDVVSRRKEREQNKKVLERLGITAEKQLAGMARLKLVEGGK